MNKYIETNHEHVIEDYPYSFTLRCRMVSTMEFNHKKGYRHLTQTENPKTGRMNNPKKSVYHPFMVRYIDSNGFLQTTSFDFNGAEEINRACEFLSKNFDILEKGEVKYLYALVYQALRIDMHARSHYRGINIEELKPIYTPKIDMAFDGFKNSERNLFSDIIITV